ncbi:MAG: enolase C-terminal domain-like protein [Balneolaceae bacterium]
MLSIHRYRIPFYTPFETATVSWTHREGLILRFRGGTHISIAEAAPLPGFSVESLQESAVALEDSREALTRLLTRPEKAEYFCSELNRLSLPPSAAFAISVLGASILSKKNRKPLSELFGRTPAREVKVNALIPISDRKTADEQLRYNSLQGATVVKLKVGSEPGALPEWIENWNRKFPGIQYRIDPNRSWPSEKLAEYLELFHGLPVEYIEEPCRFTSLHEFSRAASSSPIPLAADESIHSLESLKELLQNPSIKYLILKPMRIGNIFNLFETVQAHRTPDKEIIVTSMLESAVGRSILVQMAAMAGSPNRSHGLGTGGFFSKDLAESLPESVTLETKDSIGWQADHMEIIETRLTPVKAV